MSGLRRSFKKTHLRFELNQPNCHHHHYHQHQKQQDTSLSTQTRFFEAMNMEAYKKLGESCLPKRQCPSSRERNTCGESMETTELDDIKSWNNLDSIHSKTSSASEQKSWTTMDSIHSRTGPIGTMMEFGNNSLSHADESNSSFCSFGDSFSNSEFGIGGGNDISEATAKALAELSLQSRQFCTLSDRPSSSSGQPARRSSLKQKYQISSQFRRGSLTLIEETSSLD